MKLPAFIILTLVTLTGCGSATEVAPPPAEPAPPPAPSAPAPVAVAPLPEPTPEEKKKAEEAKKLEAEWKALEQKHTAEVARLTPEVRAAAKAVADKTYPTTRAGVSAALGGKHRTPGNAERDAQRHPVETLEFFGLKPTHAVLEYGPGEGWYTEVLAPALASKGKLFVTMNDPNGPRTERPTLYGTRTKLFLERIPEVYAKITPLLVDPKAPKLGVDASLDAVLLIRGAHGMHNNKMLALWLAQFHRALKPKGLLGVEQHRAAPDQNPDESSKKGYLPEPWLVAQIEAAGFKLQAKSELNANPKDTRDHPEGVWTLPPTLRLGEVDKAKYLAIGESDRMTLRFVKVEPKQATPATPATPATKPATPATTKPGGA